MTLKPLKRPVISLKGVRKTFRNNFELGPMDLTVEPGCIVAVLGPNGGGKSTLIGMLMNLIHPDSGEVSLFGLSHPEDEVAIKQRIGYVPESSVGHDELSAKSLGEFVSYWYPRWDQRLYQDLIERYKVDPDKRFGKLSKGMQRCLAFALALATGGELLLLDEPTVGVDPFARRQMLEDISRFMRDGVNDGDGRTVVFATQVMEEVRRLADYVAFLVDGEYLGLHEKDTLLEGWKTLWVDREPEEDIPGVVEVEGGSPTRIVSDSPKETEGTLSAQNIRIVRSGKVDLEEILSHLMRRHKEGLRA
ncbi:MAG: ABC transporter ATP-binding protein [Actinomycetota bacterium]|nr:ABC transporter ATP-binding protein [Actinomycetota bacterium]